jgi:hypothetical protein
MQTDQSSGFIKASSALKHFAACKQHRKIEKIIYVFVFNKFPTLYHRTLPPHSTTTTDSVETGRSGFAAVVSNQDMEDTYLPAFEAGVGSGLQAQTFT